MTRPKIVLYNPRADFFTMPLALVALASALDRKRFEVRIIDGRLEKKPAEIERFKFYQQVAWAPRTPLRAPLQSLARWRCRHDFYQLPLEKTMVEWIRPSAPQG